MLALNKIHYINKIYSSDSFRDDFPGILHSRFMKDLFKFPFVAAWYLLLCFRPLSWFPRREKIAFLCQTKNNYNTIKSIQEIIPDSFLLNNRPYPWAKFYLLPAGLAYSVSLLFLPFALFHLLKSQGKQKEAFLSFFDSYLKTYGALVVYKLYFFLLKPKAIVLTNDHSRDSLIISEICKNMIPVFFIPHGSFSGETIEEEPMFFDCALVAGRDQKQKIESHAPNAKVYIVGRPLSDGTISKFNTSPTLKEIGICVSPMDDYDIILSLIGNILQRTNAEITVRHHPTVHSVKDLQKISDIKCVKYSDFSTESPIAFLEKLDGVIAGCSGMLLDAAEMNVYPIFYDSSKRYKDFNNFVKNGVADFASSIEQCVNLLNRLSQRKPYIRDNAKHYNGVIGTDNDGKSSQLAKKIIIENSTVISAEHSI